MEIKPFNVVLALCLQSKIHLSSTALCRNCTLNIANVINIDMPKHNRVDFVKTGLKGQKETRKLDQTETR